MSNFIVTLKNAKARKTSHQFVKATTRTEAVKAAKVLATEETGIEAWMTLSVERNR